MPLPRLLLLLLAALALGWARAAPAADFAEVVGLAAPDPLGRWRAVPETGAARVLRGEVATPLRLGDAVAVGDRVETGLARVELRLPSGEHLHLAEGSRTRIEAARSLGQELGALYLRLSGPLRLTAGSVEAVVEGTRFAVELDGEEVVVQVEEGRVRVSGPAGAASLGRLEQARVGPGAAPEAQPWRPAPDAFARTWARGRPRLELGAMPTGGVVLLGPRPSAAFAGVQLSAGLAVGRRLRLDLATGAMHSGALQAGADTLRLPQQLGLSWQPAGSGLSLGAALGATWEDQRQDCGLQYQALHLGGVGSLQARRSLGRRFALVGQVEGGWVGGLSLQGGLGGQVSL